MEDNPCEAVKNNVRGTRVVAEAALSLGGRPLRADLHRQGREPDQRDGRDQARRGTARQVARASVNGTRFVVVRFGNVLGSNGSVVPRFLSQIERGRAGHGDPSGDAALLHADSGGRATGPACGCPRRPGISCSCSTWASRSASRTWLAISSACPATCQTRTLRSTFTGIRPGEKLFEELVGERRACRAIVNGGQDHSGSSPSGNRTASGNRSASANARESPRPTDCADDVIAKFCHLLPNFTTLATTRATSARVTGTAQHTLSGSPTSS